VDVIVTKASSFALAQRQRSMLGARARGACGELRDARSRGQHIEVAVDGCDQVDFANSNWHIEDV
jgi:hypothetical protein